MTSRRSLLIGVAASILCAPAIVRASSLMAVNAYSKATWLTFEEIVDNVHRYPYLDYLPSFKGSVVRANVRDAYGEYLNDFRVGKVDFERSAIEVLPL